MTAAIVFFPFIVTAAIVFFPFIMAATIVFFAFIMAAVMSTFVVMATMTFMMHMWNFDDDFAVFSVEADIAHGVFIFKRNSNWKVVDSGKT